MGSWGITMRQSDYGLDLLGTIVDTKLKKANFTTFNVMMDALEVIKADIIEETRQANHGSLSRMLYLASQRIVKHWHARCQNWYLVLGQLEIMLADRAVG